MVAAGALTCAQTAPAAGQGVTSPAAHPPGAIQIVVMPPETTIGDLASVPGASLGVMSTGIGSVPPLQTYLDVSQGNRIDDALYDQPLPRLRRAFLRVPRWSQVVRRADAAPADIVPGLLGSTLLDAGIRPEPVPAAGVAAIMVADRSGEIGRVVGGPVGVGVFSAGAGTVRKQARAVPAGGLMIAFAEPSPGRKVVPIGIVGTGFQRRSLTSDSTRTDGYVLSTDIAPTILRRLGLPIPDEMDGEPIRSDGAADPAAVSDLVDRMTAIPDRREPILVACILAWLLVGFAINRVVFGLRRAAMAWLGLCSAYMPLMLLVGAWLEPGAVAEGLLVGLGAAVLAALTVRFARGWRGLAIACAITVIAYAVDVIAGSGLTRLSLLGPNPIFGARFYGIGNELEALFAVMVPVGVAAGLSAYSGWGRGVTRRAAIAAFLVAGAAGAIVFGAGRLGADVGAAIVLPVGAVVAAATVPTDFVRLTPIYRANRSKSSWRRVVVAVVIAPLIALVLVALIDMVSGGNSHLTRSIIDAGGATSLSEVVERRLRLSAHDFAQAAGNPLFWIVVVGIGVAVAQRRRIDAWLRPAPIARAGLIGACAAVAVGVLVNDSGATFLVLGALALGAFLAYAWSQAEEIRTSRRNGRGLSG
jgi:hypothetical protein